MARKSGNGRVGGGSRAGAFAQGVARGTQIQPGMFVSSADPEEEDFASMRANQTLAQMFRPGRQPAFEERDKTPRAAAPGYGLTPESMRRPRVTKSEIDPEDPEKKRTIERVVQRPEVPFSAEDRDEMDRALQRGDIDQETYESYTDEYSGQLKATEAYNDAHIRARDEFKRRKAGDLPSGAPSSTVELDSEAPYVSPYSEQDKSYEESLNLVRGKGRMEEKLNKAERNSPERRPETEDSEAEAAERESREWKIKAGLIKPSKEDADYDPERDAYVLPADLKPADKPYIPGETVRASVSPFSNARSLGRGIDPEEARADRAKAKESAERRAELDDKIRKSIEEQDRRRDARQGVKKEKEVEVEVEAPDARVEPVGFPNINATTSHGQTMIEQGIMANYTEPKETTDRIYPPSSGVSESEAPDFDVPTDFDTLEDHYNNRTKVATSAAHNAAIVDSYHRALTRQKMLHKADMSMLNTKDPKQAEKHAELADKVNGITSRLKDVKKVLDRANISVVKKEAGSLSENASSDESMDDYTKHNFLVNSIKDTVAKARNASTADERNAHIQGALTLKKSLEDLKATGAVFSNTETMCSGRGCLNTVAPVDYGKPTQFEDDDFCPSCRSTGGEGRPSSEEFNVRTKPSKSKNARRPELVVSGKSASDFTLPRDLGYGPISELQTRRENDKVKAKMDEDWAQGPSTDDLEEVKNLKIEDDKD